MGKGTQAERLEKDFDWIHVSTGDMLREAVEEGSLLGQRVQAYMERGDLVPDDLMVETVQDRLGREDCRRGFVLDGFPRTVSQAESLDAILAGWRERLDGVVSITASDEEIVSRLSKRFVCSGCGHILMGDGSGEGEVCPVCGGRVVHRDDDEPETIRHRLAVYESRTRPLLDYYGGRSLLREVDGVGTVEDVYERVLSALALSRGER